VYISKTLTIQGGYTTTNWTPSDPDANLTTLNAQGQGRVVYITGNISPTIEGLRLTGGNAGKYVKCSACGMENCCTDSCNGGGLYVFSSTATINNNRLVNNVTGSCEGVDTTANGGGIYLDHSSSRLCGNTISNNHAQDGGGIFLRNGTPVLTQNTVLSNTGAMGGGIALAESDATLSQNIIKGNHGLVGGGLDLICSTLALNDNTIRENQADQTGGGLSIRGSKATVKGNALILNTASGYWGGGLAVDVCDGACFCSTGLVYTSALNLENNSIRVNTAKYGGGLWVRQTDATLINNVVTGNRVEGDGASGSGLLVAYSSTLRSLHNTIARNRGGEGSGIYVESYQWGTTPYYSLVTLTNTILVSQSIGITSTAGNTITLEATLWGSGAWANLVDTSGAGTIITGTAERNYWDEPAFVNADSGNYRLTPTSAAIDRGIDAGVYSDLDGLSRPLGAGFDLGAFEYAVLRVFLPALRN
jgi:fibronectin-binding autotransporter adhesin